jgi:hypothetical protein
MTRYLNACNTRREIYEREAGREKMPPEVDGEETEDEILDFLDDLDMEMDQEGVSEDNAKIQPRT